MARVLPKALVFVLGLIPAVYIGYEIWLTTTGQPTSLGPDPGKAIEHFNGDWGLRFLLLTLAVTPVRQLTGWSQVVRFRRMLGLFAFFYITLHLLSYLVFMQQLNFSHVWHDIAKKPYILVGFAAFCLMVPLALTSNRWSMRRLKQSWKKLHRLIYVIVILGLIHLFWLTRSSYYEVSVYAAIVALLLGMRIYKSPRLRYSKLRGFHQGKKGGISSLTLPGNSGARFSRKDCTPSRASAD